MTKTQELEKIVRALARISTKDMDYTKTMFQGKWVYAFSLFNQAPYRIHRRAKAWVKANKKGVKG